MKILQKTTFWILLILSIYFVGFCFSYANSLRHSLWVGGEIFTIAIPMWLVWVKVERLKKALRKKKIENSRLKEENDFLRKERKEVK